MKLAKREGEVTIEMQFMADVRLKCESVEESVSNKRILDVKYQEKDIAESWI